MTTITGVKEGEAGEKEEKEGGKKKRKKKKKFSAFDSDDGADANGSGDDTDEFKMWVNFRFLNFNHNLGCIQNLAFKLRSSSRLFKSQSRPLSNFQR